MVKRAYFWILLTLLSVSGISYFIKNYNTVFPALSIDIKMNREMALEKAISLADKYDLALDQQVEMLINQAGGENRAEEILGQSIKSFRREFWYEMRDRLVSEKYQQQLIL